MSKSSELFLQIQEELSHTAEQVENGELSNLDGLLRMRKAKQEAENVLSIVKTFEDDKINEISNEAEQYGGKYCGYEIKAVNGRKTYNFKGIEPIEEAAKQVSTLQDKFKDAFEGFQKGTVQTTEENGVRYWIDSDGELQPFPELNIGKSFLTIKEIKQK